MPIYEYECPKHGRFEVYAHSWRDKKEFDKCPRLVYQNNTAYQISTVCGLKSGSAVSRITMKPDKWWFTGLYDERLDKTFRNEQEQQEYLKANDIHECKAGEFKHESPEERHARIETKAEREAREASFGEVYAEWKNGARFEDYKAPLASSEEI